MGLFFFGVFQQIYVTYRKFNKGGESLSYRVGSGYLSSNGVQQTVSTNTEIIPESPENWSVNYSLYKLTFKNDQACNCTINGQYQIYLRAGQGFSMNEVDLPVKSFIIHESDVSYNFIGAY